MSVLFKEFSTPLELEDFINDRIIGGKAIDPAKGVNVRNLTLTFTTPAKTVTFPNTAEYAIAKPNMIVNQINTQAPAGPQASIRQYGHGRGGRDSRIALIRSTDVFTGGTAATMLGLVAGTVGANEIVADKIVEILERTGSHSLTIWYDDWSKL